MRTPHTRNRAVGIWAGVAVAVVFAVLLFAAAGERVLYDGHVLPGVHVDGADVSGASESNARDQLTKLANTMQQRVLRAKAGPNELHAAAADLGVRVDASKALADARRDGHSGNPFDATFGVVLRRLRDDNIALPVQLDDKGVETAIQRWDRESIVGVGNAGLTFAGTTVAVKPGRAGKGIDRPRARALLRAAAVDPTDSTIDLPLIVRQPDVTTAQATALARRAREVLDGVYTVHSAGHTFTITGAEVARAITAPVRNGKLLLDIDAERLRNAVAAPIRALGTPPVDATFTVQSDGQVAVVPSRDGTGPDFEAIGRAILDGKRNFEAPFGATHPERDTKWASSLGITGLVSSFTTHHPCCAARVDNIHRAADLINGAIVMPGQVFSLNDSVGPRTQARGFVEAPVINEGEFQTDFGGGVSQLATTTFNAAWWGGYEIVRHTPHSIYISRYPLGREATISAPTIDLQFRNDTKHGVWLRTSYTGTSVTVALYGNTDGRTVRETYGSCSVGPEYDTLTEDRCVHIISTTEVTDERKECPVKNPSDDPSNKCARLGPGEEAAGARGETGYDVEFYRTLTDPGKPPRVEHYRWHYTMNPNVTLVGPGDATTTAPSSTVPAATTTTTPSATTTTSP